MLAAQKVKMWLTTYVQLCQLLVKSSEIARRRLVPDSEHGQENKNGFVFVFML